MIGARDALLLAASAFLRRLEGLVFAVFLAPLDLLVAARAQAAMDLGKDLARLLRVRVVLERVGVIMLRGAGMHASFVR